MKSMYIKIKKVKTELLYSFEIWCCTTGWLGPQDFGKAWWSYLQGSKLDIFTPEDGSSMLSWKVWHHSPSDAVPHPRNMETSIDILWRPKNSQIKVVCVEFMRAYRGVQLFHEVTPSHIHWIGGWVVIRASLHTLEKRKFSCPSWQMNDSLVAQPLS